MGSIKTKENVVKYVSDNDCKSCGACFNACPSGALTMEEDIEGFLRPKIDANKCSSCKLCINACPVINKDYSNNPEPDCYAAMANDEKRAMCSSGGAFAVFAEYVIDHSGYVCGAAFDEKWNVHHIIVNNKDDLKKLFGSKYVQSDIGACYKTIKSLLEQKRLVLFSGTPCQAAGLKSYLHYKTYENLLIVEVLCHGATSRKVWQKYLNENFDFKDIVDIKFRDKKSFGWKSSMNIIFKKNKPFHEGWQPELNQKNDYYKSFLHLLSNNKCCSPCVYAKLPRQGDITLGDWWLIGKIDEKMDDSKGTSLLLVNNKKGNKFFKKIKHEFIACKRIDLYKTTPEYLHFHQPVVCSTIPNPNRNLFFKNLDSLTYKKNINAIFDKKFDVCLLTAFFAENYGSILVAYASHYLISELGYSILMFQKPLWFWGGINGKMYLQNKAQDFAKKHYILSKPAPNLDGLKHLNNCCDCFVIGSDILLGWWLPFLSYCPLQFVNDNKKKIAFATSFGVVETAEHIKKDSTIKHYLNRFNYFSTREYIKPIIDDALGMKGRVEELIDPTLVVPNSEWHKLMEESKYIPPTKNKYLLVYMIHNNEKKIKAAHYIADKLKLDIINVDPLSKENQVANDFKHSSTVTPEDFLKLICNAEFVFTDSFHGACFSLKFGKKFIVTEENLDHCRFEVFNRLNLSSRILDNTEIIYTNDNILKVDNNYTEAYDKLAKMVDKSKAWLANALKR